MDSQAYGTADLDSLPRCRSFDETWSQDELTPEEQVFYGKVSFFHTTSSIFFRIQSAHTESCNLASSGKA
jgi:hypothetical protein